jgi:hypothetical protein
MSSVLITGCSSGYGKATAQAFLNEGWNVIATMRRPQNDLFDGPSERVRVLSLDVTDDESIRSALNDAIDAFGGIDVLVNNAGIGQFSPLETTSQKTIKSVFETNTFGVMAMIQAILHQRHVRRHVRREAAEFCLRRQQVRRRRIIGSALFRTGPVRHPCEDGRARLWAADRVHRQHHGRSGRQLYHPAISAPSRSYDGPFEGFGFHDRQRCGGRRASLRHRDQRPVENASGAGRDHERGEAAQHVRTGILREAARIDRATEERLAARHARAGLASDFRCLKSALERHWRHLAAG